MLIGLISKNDAMQVQNVLIILKVYIWAGHRQSARRILIQGTKLKFI